MNVHLLPYYNKQSQQNFLDTVTNHSINCKTEKIKKFHPNIIKNNNYDSYPIWGVTNGGSDRNKKQWEIFHICNKLILTVLHLLLLRLISKYRP